MQNPQAGIDASGNAVVVSAPGADLKTIVGGTRALRAQGWLATTIAPPEGRSRGAGELAVGPSGDVVLLATVLRQECNSYRDNCHRAVQAFSRSPSGEWSPPLDISNPAVDAFRHGGGGDFPSAAVDATGGAVAAWISWDGNANSLLVATRARRGEGWSSPVWMWGQGISGLQTAANAAGSAILAFTTYDGVESTIRVARRPSTTAGWLASEQLGSGTVSAVTQANVGSDGRALVAWCSYQGFDLPRLFGAALFDGRSWSTKELPAFGDCASSSPQLALQPGGRVMAVWKNDDRKLVAASSSDLGTWSTPLVISVWHGLTDADWPFVGAGSAGHVLATWQLGYSLLARMWDPRKKRWGPTSVVDDYKWIKSPAAAVDAQGRAVVAWLREGDYRSYKGELRARTLVTRAAKKR